MAVAFEADVERALRGISLDFEHPCRRDPFICDFLLRGSPRVAIDCKFNVHRDWDREIATVMLLRENLPCDVVLIVVPYLNDLATTRLAEITALNGEVVALADLPSRLRDLRSKSRA